MNTETPETNQTSARAALEAAGFLRVAGSRQSRGMAEWRPPAGSDAVLAATESIHGGWLWWGPEAGPNEYVRAETEEEALAFVQARWLT